MTLLGLGRHGGGVAAARYLARAGARLTITDQSPAESLADSLAALDGLPLARLQLGGHQLEDFAEAEWLVVNPAVRPGNPWVESALRQGARVTSELELSLAGCPARITAVTGSNGKSTTAALIAAAIERSGRRAWLRGNNEASLLDVLDQVAPDDEVVLEVSSFQLHWLSSACPGPELAVVTSFAANHLDWHGDLDHYRRSKQRLLALLSPDARAVFDADDPALAGWRSLVGHRHLAPWPVADLPDGRLPGEHNRRNAALAAAAAACLGCSAEAIRQAWQEFAGLPFRLERLPPAAGRTVVDDSQATTPESTMAALEALHGRLWLLVGGADKGSPTRELAAAIARRATGVGCYGTLGPRVAAEVQAWQSPPRVHLAATLDEAVAWCWAESREGDTVLLSPGAASTDQFRDYRHRSQAFRRRIAELAGPG